jgi:hypothetical protein
MPFSDQTAGQTYDFSNEYNGEGAATLFDDDTGSFWRIDNPLAEEWVEVEFSSAQDVVKLRALSRPNATLAAQQSPVGLRLKASNTGSFGGEEVTLLNVSGLSWAASEWKEWEFSNGTEYIYYRLYMDKGSSDDWLILIESEWMTLDVDEVEDEFGVDDEVSSIGGAYLVESPDEFGVDDLISAQGGYQEVSSPDEFGVDDLISVEGEYQHGSDDEFGLSDWTDAFFPDDEILDGFGVDDHIDAGYEFNAPADAEDLGISDFTDALNWSEFLRDNKDLFVITYFCTLTGAADGEADAVLPIQSFQARKRDGEDTYVSAVIPGIDYLDEISDRPNGQIVIEMAYFSGGSELLREEILRVDLENVRYDKGARSRAVTISGHRTESFAVNLVDLEKPSYKYLSEGKLRYRFPIPNPWLNPGDTCRVLSEGDEFRVDYITYIVSDAQKFMEVSEI